MEALIRFAEREEIRPLIAAATENGSVRGVVIDVDPIWQWAWLRHEAGLTLPAPSRWFDFWDLVRARAWLAHPLARRSPAVMGAFDTKWKPEWWSDYLHATERKLDDPFYIKVCLRSESSQRRPELPSVGVPIIFERRTDAELTAGNPRGHHSPLVGGVSGGVTASDAFTIGGVVRDGGSVYGVTCAHCVTGPTRVNQPSALDGTAAPVGDVIDRKDPEENTIGTLCNPWAPGVTLNELDVALIKLTRGALGEVLDIGVVARVAARASASPGQTVQVTGRTSGHQYLDVGALAAVYRLERDGKSYCFRNLFELRQPYSTGPACARGDSGAWVCSATGPSKANWVGMVIGADASIGYCTFAESIEDWWLSEGYSLSP